MGRFAQLTKYKNNVLQELITNTNLVKALVNTEENFLNIDLPNGFFPPSIIYSQIFPYQFIADIEDTPKTYITMSFGNYKYINNLFKSGILTFFIYTHKELMKSDYGQRTDYILDQVDSMFNKDSNVGVFSLELNGGGDFKANDNHFGSTISYKFTDF